MSDAGKYKEGNCTICTKWFPLLHWHHTVPQALGGKDSLQIPLCAQCHNLLHAHALALEAKHRTGRKITRRFWSNPTMENNAGDYVKIIVDAALAANVKGKFYVMQFEATPALHLALQLYKMDSKVSSLEKAIVLAISETLKNRGYLDNEHSKGNQRKGEAGIAGSLTDLWGL